MRDGTKFQIANVLASCYRARNHSTGGICSLKYIFIDMRNIRGDKLHTESTVSYQLNNHDTFEQN